MPLSHNGSAPVLRLAIFILTDSDGRLVFQSRTSRQTGPFGLPGSIPGGGVMRAEMPALILTKLKIILVGSTSF